MTSRQGSAVVEAPDERAAGVGQRIAPLSPVPAWRPSVIPAAGPASLAQRVARCTVASRTVASRTVASRTVASRTVASRTVASRTVASRTVASRGGVETSRL
jgi:hypothetical protein